MSDVPCCYQCQKITGPNTLKMCEEVRICKRICVKNPK